MKANIDPILIDKIKTKNIVLFLGSGFAFGANHPQNQKPPLGQDLSNLISKKFLGGRYNEQPLTVVSEMAISQDNLFNVQKYIAEIFYPFEPNESHLQIALYPWKAIFTTNYDRILEIAYEKTDSSPQKLSPVYRNTPEHQIFNSVNSVPYYKLHGCISYINDVELPLILSTEQYITHKDNRERLFLKLYELALDYSFLFIGYSNQDINIRTILKEIEKLKDGKPRSYMVRPNFQPEEITFWESKKITPINMGLDEFMRSLSTEITQVERQLSVFHEPVERPIYRKFSVSIKESTPSQSLSDLLDNEVEFIHSSIATKETDAQAFYKGFFNNWDPIVRNLDVQRNEKDRILTHLLLDDKFLEDEQSYFFIIKGHAGSGKSVLLKRMAWDCSVEFDKVCLFYKNNVIIRPEPIIELYNYIKERIYLFIDNATECQKGIIKLLDKCTKEKVPITIISAERSNVWNEELDIKNYVTEEYSLSYLSNEEIENLIEKLEKHNSLGFLENKTKEERKKELSNKAGRVLLVALYEATGGKTFEEIILDEYNQIRDERAKALYLTVSILHRLGSEARAGLISRVHGINFSEFKQSLYQPLEFIVFDEKNYFIGDYVYKTRHPYIAEIIFETVLKTEQERYDEYVRILRFLNIDYKSDLNAFLAITNAKKLLEIFKDPMRIRNLYKIAKENNENEPKLLQQQAIFEMNAPGGSLLKAEEYLKIAHDIIPGDLLISHSLAEISFKKAETSSNHIERNQSLITAKKLCDAIIQKNKYQPYAYHTMMKISLLKLKELLGGEEAPQIDSKIKEIERLLSTTKQYFPDKEFILDIEARFNQMIENEPKALTLLEKAYLINKASPYIALRYSKTLKRKGAVKDAVQILKETLNYVPNDKDVNYKYAHYLSIVDPTNEVDILHYYRRSFTLGDTRYEAQFWYARALYIFNQFNKSKDIFGQLSSARIGPDKKREIRGIEMENSENKIFKGSIIRDEEFYAIIRRNLYGDTIFLNKVAFKEQCQNLKVGDEIHFYLGFNYKGPIAVPIQIEL